MARRALLAAAALAAFLLSAMVWRFASRQPAIAPPAPAPAALPPPAPGPAAAPPQAAPPAPRVTASKRVRRKPERVAPAPREQAAPVEPPQAAPPPAPAGDGTLVLASSPWCNVTVDGVSHGTTPLTLKLPAGTHTVVLSNPEFHVRRTLSVEVQEGRTLRKMLDFSPEQE